MVLATTVKVENTNGFTMGVRQIHVWNQHAQSGYQTSSAVTIDAPSGGGTTATASVSVTDGKINKITITNPGSGYTHADNPIGITAADGTGAQFQCRTVGSRYV